MKFSIGQLVWVSSAFDGTVFLGPPAIVVAARLATPKIFLHNEAENRKWLEEEDISAGWVYDIMYEGQIEEAVLEEWLVPFKQKKGSGKTHSQ